MSVRTRFLLGTASVLFTCVVAANGVAKKQPPVSGTFDSDWGVVKLEQTGHKIKGSYACCGGGSIQGERQGSVINFRWIQKDDAGHGRWSIIKGGKRLEGTWGSGKSKTSGGRWDLTRRN